MTVTILISREIKYLSVFSSGWFPKTKEKENKKKGRRKKGRKKERKKDGFFLFLAGSAPGYDDLYWGSHPCAPAGSQNEDKTNPWRTAGYLMT